MSESIVKKYYDGLKAGKLIANTCEKCHGITFPADPCASTAAARRPGGANAPGRGSCST